MRWRCEVNRISRADLMRAYDSITKAAERISSLMEPGAERASAWIELKEAKQILRDALTDGAPIDVKEAA